MSIEQSHEPSGREELETDRRTERRILWKGLLALLVIVLIVTARSWWWV